MWTPPKSKLKRFTAKGRNNGGPYSDPVMPGCQSKRFVHTVYIVKDGLEAFPFE